MKLTFNFCCDRLNLSKYRRYPFMDIKAKIEQAVKKLLSDKTLMAKFEKNPASVIEELIGVDLPDDQVNQLVEGIKAKIKLDQLGNALGGLGGLFKK